MAKIYSGTTVRGLQKINYLGRDAPRTPLASPRRRGHTAINPNPTGIVSGKKKFAGPKPLKVKKIR